MGFPDLPLSGRGEKEMHRFAGFFLFEFEHFWFFAVFGLLLHEAAVTVPL